MLYTNFQAPEPSGSKEDDFEYLCVYLLFKHRLPWQVAILDLRTTILINLVKTY